MASETILFWIFSSISVLSALLSISRRQPVFGVLYLFVLGASVAALFALKNAFFLALIQIIVYVGAVLVLFVFVIAMMNLRTEELAFGRARRWRFFVFLPIIPLFVMFTVSLVDNDVLNESIFHYFPVKYVGQALYKDLLFQFEFLSIFLLVAIVVTVFVGMKVRR